VNSAAARYL
jgi:aconitate hydratase